MIPPDQFLSSYVFFTDPTYPETDLVFVRQKTSKGTFEDVTLDCIGTLTGWASAGGDYEYMRADLVRNNLAKQGMCDNGRHEAKSKARFGLTVWGWGSDLTSPAFFTSAVSCA